MAYRLMGWLHARALAGGGATAGQGTVEYVGLILLIAALLAAVGAAAKSHDFGLAKSIAGKLKSLIDGMAAGSGS